MLAQKPGNGLNQLVLWLAKGLAGLPVAKHYAAHHIPFSDDGGRQCNGQGIRSVLSDGDVLFALVVLVELTAFHHLFQTPGDVLFQKLTPGRSGHSDNGVPIRNKTNSCGVKADGKNS